MNNKMKKLAVCLTRCGAILVFWGAMLSDGGSRRLFLLPTLTGIFLAAAGQLLRWLCTENGASFRKGQCDEKIAVPATRPAPVIAFPVQNIPA